MTTKLMAGIDLHSNNLFCGMVDLGGKRVFEKKLPCDLPTVIKALKPFKTRLETIAVESTYNWYWLVDGLQDHGYPVVLANPAAMQQYDGLKHGDDKSDAFFLAEMLRLKILPTGYICERRWRAVRDLLRRRMGLVHKRTSLILSLKSLHTRTTGQDLSLSRVKALAPTDAEKLFEHPADQLITPGVRTSRIPKTHVAIMAGLAICFSRRYSITLKRSLSVDPGFVSQWYTKSRGKYSIAAIHATIEMMWNDLTHG